ncbi:MAG: transcriptional regulator [Prevotella sp.]|nr:transcriptional regulator [Prevotella sp.]
MAFVTSEVYKEMGNETMQKRWLAISALSDLRCSIMNQASLWMLAGLLSQEGDNERAYRYIDYSWKCASQYNAHLRSWQISPILTTINDRYKSQLNKTNRLLWMLVAVVSLLSVVLLALYIYVARKRRQLATAQRELRKANAELASLNSQLQETNHKLSQSNTLLQQTNEQLSQTMMRLNDSNRVKDEYIGKFLNICSEYIDKLDNYRKRVNRKLKAGQHADLLRMTGSEQLKEDELKELFDNFDSVFLNLFPTFIDDFNALLKPEERITPPSAGRLNTDLRIFALIRLGIDESSKIADFLRYSPNSIYAYRARIKNKAAGERENFERMVKEIGM